jgi:prepilin-type N-terminal cleavage/methylation domain-containing protein
MILNPVQSRSRRHGGFTLTEMIVVIIIVAAMVSIVAVGTIGTLRSNVMSNAVNQVSAKFAAARAIALREGRDTAVFFFTRSDGEVEMRLLITDNPNAAGPILFRDLDDRPAERLPEKARVAGPDFLSVSATTTWIRPGSGAPSDVYLAVWFGRDGTTRTSSLTGVTSLWYDADNDSTVDAGETARPIPFLAVYNQTPADLVAQTPAALDTWLNNPSASAVEPWPRVIAFGRYSGAVLPTVEGP